MASINTNASAMTALQTLNSISKNMATTQSRISTGLRVAEASDNSAYWSIATSMKSDNKALSAVQDALGLGAGKIDTAYTGMNSALEAVDEIKQKLITARGASVEDKAKIQAEIDAYQDQLTAISNSASYAGDNWLSRNSDTDPTSVSVVSSFADGAVGTINIDLSTVTLVDAGAGNGLLETVGAASGSTVLGMSVVGTTDADIDNLITDIDTALGTMATAASNLGAGKMRIDLQKDFVSKLSDAIERGVGQLVDADMNEESARLSALQVQQQLGVQALSIANQNTQGILSLFR